METMKSELMRGDEVRAYFGGMSRVSLWRYVNAGKIPAPIQLSRRASRWVRAEVETARQKMIEARNEERV